MNHNFYGVFFRIVRFFLRLGYPKYSLQLSQPLTEPVVFVSHHQNLFGPFVTLLWFPKSLHAWILDVFLEQRTCYQQYVDYTFTKRHGMNTVLAKICAFPLSFFISKLLSSGGGIPVFRGSRKIIGTFRKSVEALKKGESIVIFPDIDYSDTSSSMKEMYEGFLYLEKYYFNDTGKHLCFVPLFASKNKKVIIADKPIYFRDGKDFDKERKIVYLKIHDRLNDLAEKCGDI